MTERKIGPNKKKKKRNRLIFRSIILAILLVAVVYALVSNLSKDETKIDTGDQAPDFTLEQVNANNELESIKLSDLKGKGVMLNFWATYCKPCEAEMPYMEKLYPAYKDKGIEIVAVSLDATQLVIDRFIDKYDLTFPVLHDTKSQVMDQYGVGPIPSTFFINPDGEVVEIVEGALTLDKLEGYLQQIAPK
ncbi:thiol-disulfide oxidoreductase ResA [Virgibacillus dakarensis]|uniref:Thiol-disulfide oxidoreductase ResA n=1 Tax=Lentibacillus populi TaxID=1827502 RepID=A0A9W5TV36_9BACI|nr:MULTISPECIES: thiol-disulfide oxidoreductase ResA [Bacillaceae]MBT2214307.1 thiol-disulfide oxidoreductase ResA [Virgibacillus dakarensis]MTW84984.1 thiol-disulfide oxidoreductase ResA [Virgibacillus dakarensis]GGB33803.1 thiol-disulfide oxidoreductase ResA [Lentibacillus populi]